MSEPERKPRASKIPGWAIRGLVGAFLFGALLSLVLIYMTVRGLAASWSGTGLPSFQFSSSGKATAGDEATAEVPILDKLPDPWDGKERVTVLLMGLDFRDWQAGEGPPRTDSMMLVTLDPVSKTGGMMSIPRDLWVEIPGYGHGRINTAYFLGERDRLPGGGPELAVNTVEKLLGVPIQYYVQIDFGAFERMVDEIGGVEMVIPEEIRVDPIGPDNTVILQPGRQVLSGPVALGYARNRKTEGGDFDRASRQQQVALAIRSQILRLNMIPTLVTKAPALYQEVAEGINTNLSLDQMLALGMLALDISQENIGRAVIAPPEMVTLEKVIYGGDEADVLKPVPDKIRLLRDEIFTASGAIGPSIETGDPSSAAMTEGARVAVYNGAGEEGVAGRFAEALTTMGLNVVEVANADRMDYPTTRLVDYTGNPYTTQYLLEKMGLTQSQILFQTIPDNEIDVAVVIGYDWLEKFGMLSSN
jgi:LCP family protein required for cell wall assembly